MTSVLGAPQIIWIALVAYGLITAIVKHGKLQKGNSNAYTQFVLTIIVALLLYWGGFFS